MLMKWGFNNMSVSVGVHFISWYQCTNIKTNFNRRSLHNSTKLL